MTAPQCYNYILMNTFTVSLKSSIYLLYTFLIGIYIWMLQPQASSSWLNNIFLAKVNKECIF